MAESNPSKEQSELSDIPESTKDVSKKEQLSTTTEGKKGEYLFNSEPLACVRVGTFFRGP